MLAPGTDCSLDVSDPGTAQVYEADGAMCMCNGLLSVRNRRREEVRFIAIDPVGDISFAFEAPDERKAAFRRTRDELADWIDTTFGPSGMLTIE